MTEVTAAIPGADASHPRSLHWRRASSMGSKSRDFRGGAIVLQCRVRASRRPRARMALTTPDPTSGVAGDSVEGGLFEGDHPDALTYPSSDAHPAHPHGRKDSSSPHVGAPPWTRCSPARVCPVEEESHRRTHPECPIRERAAKGAATVGPMKSGRQVGGRVIGLGMTLLIVVTTSCSSSIPTPSPTTSSPPLPVATAPTPIAWSACAGNAGLQCGSVSVPIDYSHPNGNTLSVAGARSLALYPARRIGTLGVNPGGPGESGIQ